MHVVIFNAANKMILKWFIKQTSGKRKQMLNHFIYPK